jgi:two-component system response regulator YesN
MVMEKKPHVVLIDLKMPGLDGDEVLSLMKSVMPPPKVIFVSAYDDGGKTKAKLLRRGAHAYFDKPISSLRILEAAINRAVEEVKGPDA